MADLLAVLGFDLALALIGVLLTIRGQLTISITKPKPRSGGGNG